MTEPLKPINNNNKSDKNETSKINFKKRPKEKKGTKV